MSLLVGAESIGACFTQFGTRAFLNRTHQFYYRQAHKMVFFCERLLAAIAPNNATMRIPKAIWHFIERNWLEHEIIRRSFSSYCKGRIAVTV